MDESDVVEAEVLPAYAGMIPLQDFSALCQQRAPRVCGDDPAECGTKVWDDDVLPAYAGMIRQGRRRR